MIHTDIKAPTYSFRTLNYLGSKLRLLDFIEENVSDITPTGSGICDLFAGSGCVSYRLSRCYPIVSCDIQKYSQVICNALLNKYEITNSDASSFMNYLKKNHTKDLLESFRPLIEFEEQAINNKDLNGLSEILEHGSVEVFNLEGKQSMLTDRLQKVWTNLNHDGLEETTTLVSRYYGGVYFSYRQAVQLDIILDHIHTDVPQEQKDLYLAALLSTASDIAATVGKHFAQPLKARDSKGNVKIAVYNKAVKDKTIDVFRLYANWLDKYISLSKSNYKHSTIQGDYMDCLHTLPESVKTIYADPPYTRDHYSRFYHVLETMVLRDMPEISTVNIHGTSHVSNGIYRKDRHQSPFCIRSKAPEAFRQMFEAISTTNRKLLLSYSPYDENKKTHPRVVTMKQLISLAEQYFKQVSSVSAGHFSHNKLNSTEHFLESSDEAEMLIICSNN